MKEVETNLLFWNASIDELKKGYTFDNKKARYVCLVCGEEFEEGIVYECEDKYVTAEKMIQLHISYLHGGMFEYLLNLNKKYTGLTDNQKEVIRCFYDQLSDREISHRLQLTDSTIRNYRFKFNEREKQAKIFTVIMELLNAKNPKIQMLIQKYIKQQIER